MSKHSVGTRFQNYQQYCDLVDETLAAFRAPLMNGLPMAGDAKLLIQDGRLFYVKNPEYMLIFSAYQGYYKLYYIAQENAELRIPPGGLPVVADQVRLEAREYPQYDALMGKSGFTLSRVNVGMVRKLDGSLKQELYVPSGTLSNIVVDIAMPGELFKIDSLLRNVFDPLLDELPSKEELKKIIGDGHVFVIRDHEKIAATMIRISKGATAMMHWIAVDKRYRSLKLSGIIAYAGDADSMKKGYHQVSIWVDEKAGGWVRTIEQRGYTFTKRRLYTYVLNPQGAV